MPTGMDQCRGQMTSQLPSLFWTCCCASGPSSPGQAVVGVMWEQAQPKSLRSWFQRSGAPWQKPHGSGHGGQSVLPGQETLPGL